MIRRWSLATVLLAVSLGAGCGPRPDQPAPAAGLRDTVTLGSGADEQEYLDLTPGEPVWPEGVTFNDTTRMATLYARTMGLDAIFRRARLVYGDDLRGMINVRMIIEPDGRVSSVELLNDSWSDPWAAALTDSMLFLIQRWTFPPGLEKPLALVQPFKFEPRE